MSSLKFSTPAHVALTYTSVWDAEAFRHSARRALAPLAEVGSYLPLSRFYFSPLTRPTRIPAQFLAFE